MRACDGPRAGAHGAARAFGYVQSRQCRSTTVAQQKRCASAPGPRVLPAEESRGCCQPAIPMQGVSSPRCACGSRAGARVQALMVYSCLQQILHMARRAVGADVSLAVAPHRPRASAQYQVDAPCSSGAPSAAVFPGVSLLIKCVREKKDVTSKVLKTNRLPSCTLENNVPVASTQSRAP